MFKELGFDSTHGNSTQSLRSLSKQETYPNFKLVMNIFNIQNKQDELDLPYLY